MSTPLHVLLKADPRLEGDVADDKADPLVCLYVLQYFHRIGPLGRFDHRVVMSVVCLSPSHAIFFVCNKTDSCV